jgi:hypothetical protein
MVLPENRKLWAPRKLQGSERLRGRLKQGSAKSYKDFTQHILENQKNDAITFCPRQWQSSTSRWTTQGGDRGTKSQVERKGLVTPSTVSKGQVRG